MSHHKIIVCACEDVTLHDLETAAERGLCEMETLKRYTGFGTGPCQGKSCQLAVAKFLASRDGSTDIKPFAVRPPLCGVPLKVFASKDD